MRRESTIIKIDINGFNKLAQEENPEDTARYLSAYYELAASAVAKFGWRFVKAIGDCILISTEGDAEPNKITAFYQIIQENFDVSLYYRPCEFEEIETKVGNYSCLDVIGKDINNLFLNDAFSVGIGQ